MEDVLPRKLRSYFITLFKKIGLLTMRLKMC